MKLVSNLCTEGKDRSSKASVRATKKASDVSVQQAVMSFHSDIKNGPDFVCSCCYRLMYSKSVVPCNIASAATTCWNVCSVLTSDMLAILAMSGCVRHVTARSNAIASYS